MIFAFREILDAYQFVSASSTDEHQAYLCKESGKIFLHTEVLGDEEENRLPEDIDEEGKYLQIPDKRELGLGKPLALDFAREVLPSDFNKVREIFSKRGAYARFRDLLEYRNALDRWCEFEAKAQEKALREWCELNSIEVSD
jgi:Uncharacterised protein family (UPF0158)